MSVRCSIVSALIRIALRLVRMGSELVPRHDSRPHSEAQERKP
jgi:hypothetical protein